MSHESHRLAADAISARCAVITLSDTRDEGTDASGAAIRRLLDGAGHQVGAYELIRDDPAVLESLLRRLLAQNGIDAIITNGGTGVSRRDNTISAVTRCIDRELKGFGEIFRMLSFEQVGSAAMLSNAMAGIASAKPVFALPGSTKAVELAMTRLILPELKHLLHELRK